MACCFTQLELTKRMINFAFIITNILLGVGLAMDAFSVSIADGLGEPNMKRSKTLLIAGTFAVYQYLMPMIGWVCVHYLVEKFQSFQKFIPWIALILLGYIGGKMLIEGIKGGEDEEAKTGLSFGMLMVQGIATAIDALSVGFTIANYDALAANIASIIIGIVTLVICLIGLKLGKTVGNKLSNKASILGGIILIAIGIEVFLSNIL